MASYDGAWLVVYMLVVYMALVYMASSVLGLVYTGLGTLTVPYTLSSSMTCRAAVPL